MALVVVGKLKRIIERKNATKKYSPVSMAQATRLSHKPHYVFLQKWIPRNLLKSDSILEVCCGVGLFGTWLQSRGYMNYVGIDISPARIEVATEFNPLDFRVGDGRALAFKDKSFDFVGYANCFSYVTFSETYDCLKFLDEGLRVARKWLELDAVHSRPGWNPPSFERVRQWLRERGIEDNLIVERELFGNRRLWIVEL